MTHEMSGQRIAPSPWTARIVREEQVGLNEPPAWLATSYLAFRRHVTHPGFPCYFGTNAESRGEMFYSYVGRDLTHLPGKLDLTHLPVTLDLTHLPVTLDLTHLPVTMATFARLSSRLENQRNNFAVFFEPEPGCFTHDDFRALCWRVLQYLHDHDQHPTALGQPDPADPAWEFCFAGLQMFVVGCSPTYVRRRSRNLGPGVVMLFQPRSVFIDTLTNRAISIEARAAVRRRLLTWDRGVPAHPDLGIFGDPDNQEWKQYVLPDNDEPTTTACPFLSRLAQHAEAEGQRAERKGGALPNALPTAPSYGLDQRPQSPPKD